MFSGNGGFASPESGMMLATSSDGFHRPSCDPGAERLHVGRHVQPPGQPRARTFTNIAGPNASRAAPLYTRADVRDPSLLRWSDGQW